MSTSRERGAASARTVATAAATFSDFENDFKISASPSPSTGGPVLFWRLVHSVTSTSSSLSALAILLSYSVGGGGCDRVRCQDSYLRLCVSACPRVAATRNRANKAQPKSDEAPTDRVSTDPAGYWRAAAGVCGGVLNSPSKITSANES